MSKLMDKDQRKLNENTIDSELCEFCGKTFRKCNLLQHQRSRGCMKKEKTASELGNRSILEFFQIKKLPTQKKSPFIDDTQHPKAVIEGHVIRLTDRERAHILTEHNLLKFNKVVGSDIELFGKALKLSQVDIDGVRIENSNSFTTLIHKVILKWRNINAKNATLGLFTKCLIEAETAGARVDWDVFNEGVKDVLS